METFGRGTIGSVGVVLDEVLVRAVRFPLWWYSGGLVEFGRRVLRAEAEWLERLGLRILLTNLFTPMFGDYSRSGRVISFFMRIVLLVVKGVFAVVLTVVLLAVFALYLALPAVVVAQLVYQLGGSLLWQ